MSDHGLSRWKSLESPKNTSRSLDYTDFKERLHTFLFFFKGFLFCVIRDFWPF